MKKIAIIPAYNEREGIVKTVQDLQTHAPSFDYVVVNDCSTDDTLDVCEAEGLHVLKLPTNLGIGGAVQTGYRYALRNGYDLAVQFDGDGQHDAAYLETMVEEMKRNGADMVIGSRFIRKEGFQSSGMRRVGIRYFTGLIYLVTRKKITDPTSGLRLVNKKVLKLFAAEYPKDYPEPESTVTLLKKGMKVEEIPVRMKQRETGVSSISPKKSVYYMIKVSLAILIACLRK